MLFGDYTYSHALMMVVALLMPSLGFRNQGDAHED